MNFKNKSIISIHDLSKEEILHILEVASEFEKNPVQNILLGKVVSTVFYEPSTRTRLSFESAVTRLGGSIIGISNVANSSVQKGESLKDMIMMLKSYSDLIVLRHPNEGSARYASEVSCEIPLVNGGDGANQHPTQTLLDLYSIKRTQGKLDKLNIVFVGDFKYGRTVNSLALALMHFNCKFTFVSPKELEIPENLRISLNEKGIDFVETRDLINNIPKADIIYVTRIQKERFADEQEYEKVKGKYIFKADMLKDCKPSMKIMHPLPRVNEIAVDVDDTVHAYYFTQAKNGVFVRQAIIALLLGKK